MNSKQRANLRAIASKTSPIFQIGKEGISQSQLSGMKQALSKRELIKVSVLKSSEISAKEIGVNLAQRLEAELITVIGNKIVLYKLSDDKNIQHLEF